MINIYENNIKMPPCPKKAKPHDYKTKKIIKVDDDGSESEFYILTSKASAAAFICHTLDDYNFPMARPDFMLREFHEDPAYYEEEMLNWEDSFYNYYCPQDDSTYCDFGGTHVFLEDDGLQGAITAFKKAGTVTSLFQSTEGDITLYNGYIYYEYDERHNFGMWRADTGLPSDEELNEYKWENIYGTFVQIID